MILYNGDEYYPLGIGKIVKNGDVYYDRSARQKSWFYLDLSLEHQPDAIRVRDPTYLLSNP